MVVCSGTIAVIIVVDERTNDRLVVDSKKTDITASARKQVLIDQITSKLQQELHEKYSKIANDLDKEFSIEAKLSSSSTSSKAKIAQLQDIRRVLCESANEIDSQLAKLQSSAALSHIDHQSAPIDCLSPYDDLSDQVIRVTAEQLAIDDALYFLSKALTAENRKYDFNSFVKESRKLARLQFLAKVHLLKIQNATSTMPF